MIGVSAQFSNIRVEQMNDTTEAVEKVRSVKAKYQEELMNKANVVGVGIGFRHRVGQRTEEVVLVVMVDKKVAATALAEADLVPSKLEGVVVDVQEVGRIRAEGQSVTSGP